jgi:hypothetical protein
MMLIALKTSAHKDGRPMRKYLVLGTLMAFGAGGSAVAAEDISYNLLEVSYVSNEIEAFGLDGSGLGVSGSLEFNERVFGFASLVGADYDQGSDLSTTAVSVGVGFAWPLGGGNVDLVSGVAYERLRLHVDGAGNATEEGFSLNTGLRGRVGESLELAGGVKYIDFGDGLDDFTLSAGGRYYFTPAFAAGIDVSDNDDGTAWMVSLRYDFGAR